MNQPSWGNAPVGWRVETTPAFEREVRKLVTLDHLAQKSLRRFPSVLAARAKS